MSTTGDGAGLDWEKVAEVLYEGTDELVLLAEQYDDAVGEQFPVLRRDLGLNEGGGLFAWLDVFQIVSLERTEPFLAAYGLPGCDSAVLRSVTREALVAIYAAEEDESVPLSAMVEMIEHALDRLAEEAGPACAEAVREYCVERNPYFPAYSRRENDWRRLFDKLVYGHEAQYPDVETAMAPAALRAVREAFRHHVDATLNQRSIDADRAPLTPWDEVVYARYDGFGGENPCSPFDTMSEVAYHFQVQAAWKAIEDALAPDDIEALLDWGRRQAAVMPGMRPERIAPPPTPRPPRRT